MSRSHITTALLGCVLAAGLVLGGCIFDTRDPEPPTTSSIDYIDAFSAVAVWENCRLALNNSDLGGWDSAVLEDFRYYPDSEAADAYPGAPWDQNADWTKETELSFISSWFASGVSIEADLLNGGDADNTPDGDGTRAEWEITYLINVTNSQDGSVTRYRARATLEFKAEGSFWYLATWRDDQGENDPDTGDPLQSMGFLRGAFAP